VSGPRRTICAASLGAAAVHRLLRNRAFNARAMRCARLRSFVRKSSASEAQSRDCVEPRCRGARKENDWQLGRQRSELTAQLETAFGLVLEGNVDDGEVGAGGKANAVIAWDRFCVGAYYVAPRV